MKNRYSDKLNKPVMSEGSNKVIKSVNKYVVKTIKNSLNAKSK